MFPKVTVALRSRDSTTALHFTRKPVAEILLSAEQRALGEYALCEVAKDIGSNLTGIWQAKRELERFLEQGAQ